MDGPFCAHAWRWPVPGEDFLWCACEYLKLSIWVRLLTQVYIWFKVFAWAAQCCLIQRPIIQTTVGMSPPTEFPSQHHLYKQDGLLWPPTPWGHTGDNHERASCKMWQSYHLNGRSVIGLTSKDICARQRHAIFAKCLGVPLFKARMCTNVRKPAVLKPPNKAGFNQMRQACGTVSWSCGRTRQFNFQSAPFMDVPSISSRTKSSQELHGRNVLMNTHANGPRSHTRPDGSVLHVCTIVSMNNAPADSWACERIRDKQSNTSRACMKKHMKKDSKLDMRNCIHMSWAVFSFWVNNVVVLCIHHPSLADRMRAHIACLYTVVASCRELSQAIAYRYQHQELS